MTSPEVYATFSVTSKCVCFGALHNIWQGASAPIQGFIAVPPCSNGTVKTHQHQFNVTSQNGVWNSFQLVNSQDKTVCGWFLCHSRISPEQEIDKILRVSGSPYEPDSGSHVNNEKTRGEGVLVINRYDWGYYDQRFREEVGEGMEEGNSDVLANSNSAGLVDYAQAKIQVRDWKQQRPSQRGSSESGIWMYVPHAEYMFGRFGFDETHTAARSFLFFNTHTDFTRTTLAGLQQTLRKAETPQERFERRLQEGYDFSGLEELHEMTAPPEDHTILNLLPLPPQDSQCLGPYDLRNHILRPEDIEHLRLAKRILSDHLDDTLREEGINLDAFQPSRNLAEFVDPWKEPVYDLLNELALAYLERFVLPHASYSTRSSASEALFFNSESDSANQRMTSQLRSHFTEPQANRLPNFDAESVGKRSLNFLKSRSRSDLVRFDHDCTLGISHVIAHLISEVLKLASKCAIDSSHYGIVPYDIRIQVLHDPELFSVLQYSKVFWNGRA